MTTTTLPAHTPPPPDAPPDDGGGSPKLLSEIVPQEFHDRPYLKDLLGKTQTSETFAEVFKKLDGAEKLVGKKTGIPEADAKPEEWDQFFAKLRPGKAEDYEIKAKEGSTPDPEFTKAIKTAFFEAGLTKAQATKVQERIQASVDANQAGAVEAQKKMDAEFEALNKATFGADNVKALDRAKGMLQELTPDNLKPFVSKLPNESLVILAGILNAVHSKYGLEDRVDGKGAGAPVDESSLREEGRKLMASAEYKDSWNPKHDQTVARVKQIYEDIGKGKK